MKRLQLLSFSDEAKLKMSTRGLQYAFSGCKSQLLYAVYSSKMGTDTAVLAYNPRKDSLRYEATPRNF